MSVPQMLEFRELGLKFFTRQSEVEINPVMYENASGIWLDGFWSNDWITKDLLDFHIGNGKTVCIVSPDLHGRENFWEFWDRLMQYRLNMERIILCTDFPDAAKEFFHETKNKSSTF